MIQRNATHVVRNKRYVKKNMVDNDRNIFEIPTIFNLTNEEIQQKTERENLKYEYWYVKKKELKFF